MTDGPTPTYRIGEVAARTALSRDTLRYYERLGLLDRPLRTSGGFRVYDESMLERVQFIKRAQAVGCSLDDIRQLVSFDGRAGGQCRRVRDLVAQKLAEVDDRLRELRVFRRSLVGTLDECDAVLAQQPDAECPVVVPGASPRARAPRERPRRRVRV